MAAKKPEVVEVSFKPAKGGVVSTTHTRTKRSGQGGGPDYDHEHEDAVHPTLESASAHLKEHLGSHFQQESAHEESAESEE